MSGALKKDRWSISLKKDRWIYEIIGEELYHKTPSTSKPSRLSSVPDKIQQPKYYHYYWCRVGFPLIWNIFNIFRLCWYGFFVRLALWSVLFPLWHKHPVTTRWWGQPGHGKAWLGKGAVKLTDGEVIRGAWVIGFYQSLKIECGWCNSPREWCNVKMSGRRFGTNKQRTIPSQPSVARVGYSSMDHSKMEDGISLCVLWMWYQLQRTQRFMDKKLDKNIIPMVSMWTWSNYHVSPWVTACLLIWRFDQQNSG